ncbi:MAG: helix-turn-helix domain-containing protein [Ruthenibacterium lactatiformans]
MTSTLLILVISSKQKPCVFQRLCQSGPHQQCNAVIGKYSQKIAEIAERVGFSNVSYFIKCFRGHTGISPAKYRQNKLAESATLQKGTFK